MFIPLGCNLNDNSLIYVNEIFKSNNNLKEIDLTGNWFKVFFKKIFKNLMKKKQKVNNNIRKDGLNLISESLKQNKTWKILNLSCKQ